MSIDALIEQALGGPLNYQRMYDAETVRDLVKAALREGRKQGRQSLTERTTT